MALTTDSCALRRRKPASGWSSHCTRGGRAEEQIRPGSLTTLLRHWINQLFALPLLWTNISLYFKLAWVRFLSMARWRPILPQTARYQVILYRSLKHLLNLSLLTHLYSLSQSWDFSPGFPHVSHSCLTGLQFCLPPRHSLLAATVSFNRWRSECITSLLQTLLFTWWSLAQSSRLISSFYGNPFLTPSVCSTAYVANLDTPSRKCYSTWWFFSFLSPLTAPMFLDSADTEFVECTHARIKCCLTCHT